MTVRVVRILVYETETQDQMDRQLSMSLPDGKKTWGDNPTRPTFGTITAYTLNSLAMVEVADALGALERCYNKLAMTNYGLITNGSRQG